MKNLIPIVSLCLSTVASADSNHNSATLSIYREHTSLDFECLALNIYHEARNESFAGQVAVADVTLNRVYDTRYPNTICEVVHQAVLSAWHLERGIEMPVRDKCQFSWFCDGKSDEPRDGDSWDTARQLSFNFLTYGEFRGITEGATHYHATYVHPDWANDKGMHMVGSIGQHIFYRWNQK